MHKQIDNTSVVLKFHEGNGQLGKTCKRAAGYNNFLKVENH